MTCVCVREDRKRRGKRDEKSECHSSLRFFSTSPLLLLLFLLPSPPTSININKRDYRSTHTYTHAVKTHTYQSEPMSTVVYCASRANTHFHGHYSPWKQASMFAHTWCWHCTRTVDALDNKLFQGQITDKNPFFYPTKKDQEWGRVKEQDKKESWNQTQSGVHLS